jgi:branched-chain amino acid transport system ATP-binding protein
MDRVLNMFPRLAERVGQSAESLSGGEQQMLAIGRALMSEPELLLVDELSLGLMPKMIDICYEAIGELNRGGLTIVLVEQSTQRALEVADQVCVLESGQTVWKGSAQKARNSAALIDSLLGLGNQRRQTGSPTN